MKNDWKNSLHQLMVQFGQEVRSRSANERQGAYEELQKEFDQSLLSLKNKITEVEYGQHVEVIYDIHREPLKIKGPF